MWAHSTVRYALVAASLAVLDLIVFVVLTEGGVSAGVSQALSRGAGALVGFGAHKLVSFHGLTRDQQEPTPRQAAAYTALTVFNIGLSAVLVAGLVRVVPGGAVVGKLCGDGVMAVLTFLVMRVIFRAAEPT